MSKQWVFRKLVDKNNKDSYYRDLIAYAIYKEAKDDYATDLAKQKLSAELLEQKLDGFHEMSVTDAQISGYRKKADTVMNSLITQLDEKVSAKHEKALKTLQEHHAKELKDIKGKAKKEAVSEYKTQIENASNARSNLLSRGMLWVFTGYQSIVATALLIIIVGGIAVWTGPKEQQRNIVEAFIGLFTTAPMPDMSVKNDKKSESQG